MLLKDSSNLSDKTIILTSFENESIARIYGSHFRAAEIPFFLSNQHMGTLIPSADISRINFHVREVDEKKAKALLLQIEEEARATMQNQEFHDADLEDIMYEKEIHKPDRLAWKALFPAAILLLVVLLLLRALLRAMGIVESSSSYF